MIAFLIHLEFVNHTVTFLSLKWEPVEFFKSQALNITARIKKEAARKVFEEAPIPVKFRS